MMDFVIAEWWLQKQLAWKDNWKLQKSSTESTEAQKNKGKKSSHRIGNRNNTSLTRSHLYTAA